MQPGEFTTWNRLLNLSVVDGPFPTELLAQRTLSLTYIDRTKEFDQIEWQLDNSDGILTRPEYLAAGMVVMLKIGYINSGFPWKAFIINRVRGGVGVYGAAQRAAVGQSESVITFHGRNRNAPGGRRGPKWRRTAQAESPSKRPKKNFPATSDITRFEMLLEQKSKARLIQGPDIHTTSDAVAEIAARNGFTGSFALIEPTDDHIEGVTIPEGMSDGQFLAKLAAQYPGYIHKIDGDTLHWHSENWAGGRQEFADVLRYGAGMDIISLTIDCDMQLPLPQSLKGKSYNPRTRTMAIGDLSWSKDNATLNIGGSIVSGIFNEPKRYKAVLRNHVIPITADNFLSATKKTTQAFIASVMRAFQLSAHCVGNPKLLAARLVKIEGTGSPFADGVWSIDEARHVVSNTTYTTDIHLKPPSKKQAAPVSKMPLVVSHHRENQDDKSTRYYGSWVSLPSKFPVGLRGR